MITENHNLIYGLAAKYKLNLDEWYDILAIELCNTVKSYDPHKSSLSTYYYLRGQGLISKEFRKRKALKRQHIDITLYDNYHGQISDDDMILDIDLKLWLEQNDCEILRLKIDGYTQMEIADKLQVSQAHVSRTLKKLQDSLKKYRGDKNDR